MNKIKDFFYDKNDIIVVLVILAVAGFIIYTRIGAIMEYPEVLAQQAAATENQESEEAQAAQSGSDSSSAAQSVTITDSDTSSSVAEKLYEAGLVSSASDFEAYISDQGASDSIQSGTFQIPSGSSDEEILNIIAE